MSLSDRPMKLLESEFKRYNKEDALHTNIVAAVLMAEVIRTSFGPFGLDKMILDPVGDIIITNDGSTIVKNFDVRHQVARILDNLVRSQDKEAGDGSKTAIILVGELLRKAFRLIENKIHPNIIIEGYEIGLEWANELLEKICFTLDSDNKNIILRNIARTALSSKLQGENEEYISDLITEAINYVIEERETKNFINLKNIFILAKKGGEISDSKLIKGMIIDKEVILDSMPKRITDAKIALVEPSLEFKKVHKFNPKIYLNHTNQMKSYRDEDLKISKNYIKNSQESGVNVALFRRDISELAQRLLSNAGILAIRFVHRDQFYAAQKAVGAKLITKLDDFSSGDLGNADLVEERKLGKKKVVFIEGCKNPKAVCILVRSGIKNVGYEVERRIIDAISSIKYTLEEERFLAGGGATEMELARNIKLKADSISGKKQIALKKFADSLEIIPKTLIETAGLNQIDFISELRACHDPKNDNCTKMGIDFKTRKPGNMMNLGVIDSYIAKYHAINAAMDVVKLILKIDDVIDQAEESAYAPPPKPREDFEED